MKNKKIIIIVVSVLAALLIAAGISLALYNNEKTSSENSSSSSQGENKNNDENKKGNGIFNFGSKKEEDGSISFPYRIPETDLVIKKVAPYDGIFFEDGSDRKVKNINAILIENVGESNIEYFEVYLNQGDIEYTFTGSTLPKGASILLQEKDMKESQKGSYTSANAVVSEVESFEMGKDFVSVQNNNDGSITINNISKRDLPCVRVFYKIYMEEENSFVGGITYVAKIENLKNGEKRNITPKHFHKDNSKIMMVKIYETVE